MSLSFPDTDNNDDNNRAFEEKNGSLGVRKNIHVPAEMNNITFWDVKV